MQSEPGRSARATMAEYTGRHSHPNGAVAMFRSTANSSRAWSALATSLLGVLIGLSAPACGRHDDEVSVEDARHVEARLRLFADALPFERLAMSFEQFGKLIETNPDLAGTRPLSKSEVDGVLAEWRRFKEVLNDGSWWRGEGPFPAEQRAKEEARFAAMQRSLDTIRESLRPHRAWVESHYGVEVFGAAPR